MNRSSQRRRQKKLKLHNHTRIQDIVGYHARLALIQAITSLAIIMFLKDQDGPTIGGIFAAIGLAAVVIWKIVPAVGHRAYIRAQDKMSASLFSQLIQIFTLAICIGFIFFKPNSDLWMGVAMIGGLIGFSGYNLIKAHRVPATTPSGLPS